MINSEGQRSLVTQFLSEPGSIPGVNRLTSLVKAQNVFFLFSFSSLALKATAMLSSFIILRWVPPVAMGVWQTLLLIQSYSDLARLGVVRGMNRELPYLLGKDERDRALGITATAQAYTLFVGLLGLIGFLAATAVPGLPATEWRVGLLCMGVVWAATCYSSYLQGTFRAHTEFKKLAYAQFLLAGLQLLSLILVVRWGYGGMVTRAALLAVLFAALLFTLRPIRVRPRFRWPDFKALLATGLPLYGSAYLYTLALGFDRVILLGKGDVETVGLYAPLSAVLTVMATLPGALNLYIYPRMSFNLGRHGDLRWLWRTSMVAMAASVAASLPVAVVGWFVLPPAMEHIFPHYLPALLPTRIALIAGVFLAASAVQVPLVVLKSWRYLYLYMGLFALSKWIFPWTLAQRLEPLTGVAVGGVVAGVVMMGVGIWTSYRATRREPSVTRAGDAP